MRIKRVPTRKIVPATDQVATIVKRLAFEATEDDLVDALELLCQASYTPGGESWGFGRSDLFHWVALLDRFDDLLGGLVGELWEASGESVEPTLVSSTHPPLQLLVQHTPFSLHQKRLVLVIVGFSRLLLENCSSRNIYASYDRLRPLLGTLDADVFEATLELLILPARKIESQSSLRSTFDRNIGEHTLMAIAGISTSSISSPSPSHPEKESLNRFIDFCKTRQEAWAKETDAGQVRRIRLLSLAIYIFATPELHLDSQNVFALSPTIITDTARQLSARPLDATQQRYEACAITLLRSSLKIASKWAELVYALNLGAGHASVASIVRSLCGGLGGSGEERFPYSAYYCSALLDFIQGLAGCHETDEALIASGIVEPILRGVEGVAVRHFRTAERLLATIDTLNGHLGEGVDAFFAADGLSATVRLVSRLVDGIYAELAAASSFHADPSVISLLTGTLKILDRLVASAGVDDRLRNLVEGNLFRSLRVVFQHQDAFGGEVLTIAVNLLSNFIHNEPTSLSILQEQGITQAFCDAIQLHVPPSGELLSKLPHAFSAVCLNSAGSEYFEQQNPLRTVLRVFLDPAEYGRCLRSHGVSSVLGTGMDEFMRHHPQLRPLVRSAILEALDEFSGQMSAMLSTTPTAWCGLQRQEQDGIEEQKQTIEPPASSKPDALVNPVSTMFDSLCSFLEGALQQTNIMSEFVSDGLIERLFRIYLTPGLPFDFILSSESFSVAHLFRLLFEAQGEELLKSIVQHLTRLGTVNLCEFIERSNLTESIFHEAVLGGTLEPANRLLKDLISVLCLLRLLCDLCVSSHYSYGVETFMWTLIGGLVSEQGRAGMVLMGLLFRVATWEQYILLESLSPELAVAGLGAAHQISRRQTSLGLSLQGPVDGAEEDRVFESKYLAPYKADPASPPIPSTDVRVRNLTAVLYVLQKIPICLMTIYGSLAKMISNRQLSQDPNKATMLEAATLLANCALHTPEWLAKHTSQLPNTAPIRRTIASTFATALLLAGVVLFNEPNFGNANGTGFGKMAVQALPMVPFAELGGLEHLYTILIGYLMSESALTEAQNDPVGFGHWWREAVEVGLLLMARLTNSLCYKISTFTDLQLSGSPASLVLYVDAAGKMVQALLDRLKSEETVKILGPSLLRLILSLSANLLPGPLVAKSAAQDYNMMMRHFAWISIQEPDDRPSERDIYVADRLATVKSSNYPNIIEAQSSLLHNYHEILSPMLGQFDRQLTYDVAVILARILSADEDSDIGDILEWLNSVDLNDWVAYTMMSILTNSQLKKQLLTGSVNELENLITDAEAAEEQGLPELLTSTFLVLSFAVALTQLDVHYGETESYSIEEALLDQIAQLSLDALLGWKESDNLDTIHAILMLALAISRHRLKVFTESEVTGPLQSQLITVCLASLRSNDVRHSSIIALAAMLMRRMIETPDLLDALMEHEAMIKYRSLNTSAHPPYMDEFLAGCNDSACFRDLDCFGQMARRVFTIRPEPKGYYRSTEKVVLRQQVLDILRLKGIPFEDQYANVTPLKERLKTLGDAEMTEKLVNGLIEAFLSASHYPCTDSMAAVKASEQNEAVVKSHYTRCVVLMFLNELITAYPICHRTFSQSPRFAEFTKCLFSRVVPCGQLGPIGSNNSSHSEKMAIFVNGPLWVDFFVTNYCVGSQLATLEESVTGLKERCALVVDGLTAALKEPEQEYCQPGQQQATPYQKLSRMWCLSMTIYSLLNNASSLKHGGSGNVRMSSSLQLVIGARMLERGYIELLSGQLRELDRFEGGETLGVPLVFGKIVVNLENLARLANRISSSVAKNAASTIALEPSSGTAAATGGLVGPTTIQEEDVHMTSSFDEDEDSSSGDESDEEDEDDEDADMEPFGYGNEHEDVTDHDESMGMLVDEDGEIILDDVGGSVSGAGGMDGSGASEMMSTDAESLASRHDEDIDEDDDEEEDYDSEDIDDEVVLGGDSDFESDPGSGSSPHRRHRRAHQILIRPPEHSRASGGTEGVSFEVPPDMLSLDVGADEAVPAHITRRFLPRGSSNLPFDITIEEYDDEEDEDGGEDGDGSEDFGDEDEDDGFDDEDDDFEGGETDFDDFDDGDDDDDHDHRFFADRASGAMPITFDTNDHHHHHHHGHNHFPIRMRRDGGNRQVMFGFGGRRGHHAGGSRRLASPIQQIFRSLLQHRTAIPRSSRGAIRGGRYASLFDTSFAGQVARTASTGNATDLYQHPFLQRPLGEPAAGSLNTVDLSVLSGSSDMNAKTYMANPDKHQPSSSTDDGASSVLSRYQNDQLLSHPVTVPTLRRWMQEAKLFYGESFIDLIEDIEDHVRGYILDDDAEKFQFLMYGPHPDKMIKEEMAVDKTSEQAKASPEVEKMPESTLADTTMTSAESAAPEQSETMSTTATAAAVDVTTASPQEPQPPATSAPPAEPVIFEDPGPDPSFLEALPFDMRPEVLAQYFAERRRALLPTTTAITINPDFLARLPQDLRDDYQRLSQADFERWQQRRSRSHGSAVAGFEQFLGSLDPAIRQMIIQSADLDGFDEEDEDDMEDFGEDDGEENGNANNDNDEIIHSYERDVEERRLAEGIGYIEGLVNQIGSAFQRITQTSTGAPTNEPASRLLVRRGSQATDSGAASSSMTRAATTTTNKDVAPLIDVSTLAQLVGYYFGSFGGVDKRLLNKLFQHISMNEARRADLLNMLILLLEQGPADAEAVKRLLGEYTGGSTSLGNPEKSPSPSMTSLRGDGSGSSAVVILQWTLQLMLSLVSHNDQVRRYFTKRSESPWTISRRLIEGGKSRKDVNNNASSSNSNCSKGKRTSFEIHYPLVVLLASLENPSISHNGMLTEHLVHLISLVSQPIKELVEGDGKKEELKELPEIPVYFLHVLVKALTSCELTPKAFSYMSHIFQHLSVLDETAGQLLLELSEHPTRILEILGRDLKALSAAAAEVKTAADPEIVAAAKERLITAGKTLSAPLSSQMRLLRLVKMMSSIMFVKPTGGGQSDNNTAATTDMAVLKGSIGSWEQVGHGLCKDAWTVLRRDLGDCLLSLGDGGEADDAVHIAPGLLPAIESYFLYQRQVAAVLPDRVNETDEATIAFSEAHRRILNTLITANHGLLVGSFAFLVNRTPRVLDFDNKRYWFNQQLHKRSSGALPASAAFRTLSLNVRRAYVFEDSFHQIMSRSGEEVKYGKISVRFHGEQGVDAGGVTREWFEVLARRMFNPDYALFKASAADKITYQPNRASWINPDHLQFFCFVGRIIGKAIYDGRLLDCYFTRAFYKHILGIPVDMKDLETIDPDFYKSLLWILENDITGVLDHLTFAIDTEEFGQQCTVDLKPNGRDIAVTEADKREYVQLVTQYRLTEAIRPQLDAFMRGFHEIIPDRLIGLFDEHELELLISGLPDIDIEDWRANTDYHGYTVQSPVIQWFWRAVRSFDAEQRAKLLQFVTGTSKVPLEGFAQLQGSTGVHKFTIHRDYRDASHRLPSAHTCFNQLDLPEYDSYEVLREMLLKVMNEAATGFGFA